MLGFSRTFRFWDPFLHLRIQNCLNSLILQLLALMWTLTKKQDVWAKLVPLDFLWRFWFWNMFICLGLGNHPSNPLLQSTSSVQNSSSQNQNLRFIYLVWIPFGSSRLPFQITDELSQMCPKLEITLGHIFNLPFPFGTYQSPTYHSYSMLNILIYHSHQKFQSTILICHSSSLRYK